MKSKAHREEVSTEGPAQGKLSLELVAATALQFLGEDHSSADRRDAVERAIRFLEICAERIEDHQRGVSERSKTLEEFKSLGWKESDTVSYSKGIKFITSQQRLDRAQAHFKAYLKYHYLRQKPLSAPELSAAIKKYEKHGFLARSLPLLRLECEATLATGRSGLKRHKKKFQET
jgi:hypothetical protein